jgi:hypothetical protein
MSDIQFHLFSANNAALRSPLTAAWGDLITIVAVSSDGQAVTFSISPTDRHSFLPSGSAFSTLTANSAQLQMPLLSARGPLKFEATITATSATLGISRDLLVVTN